MHDVLRLSAVELASGIRNGELSSLEVVETHIARIEALNPSLNAIVASRFDEARREARTADGKVRNSDDLPPFHGVPCTIKEAFAVTGMPNTSGLVARRGTLADRDAVTVERLRKAGAIVLGVTNVSELCMWMECDNRVYGRSNNPYDPTRTVGGSSGGEGAAVAAGFAPFGLGADIGGSIRMPAFFNGVFGHKPTGGLVPGSGQFPHAENEAQRMLATGPLTRRAEDLWPLMEVLAGPDGEDEFCVPFDLGHPDEVEVKRLRVLVVRGNGRIDVDDELLAAQDRCAQHFAAMGCQVEERTFDGFAHTFDLWAARMNRATDTPFSELLGNGSPVSGVLELLRIARGRSAHTLPAVMLVLLEALSDRLPESRDARLVERASELKAEVARALGDDGILLYPPFPTLAPMHGRSLLPPFKWVYTAIFNALELPVTQVPLGLSRGGLPLGVQVVARHGLDHLTVAAAMELERAFGGWVPPW